MNGGMSDSRGAHTACMMFHDSISANINSEIWSTGTVPKGPARPSSGTHKADSGTWKSAQDGQVGTASILSGLQSPSQTVLFAKDEPWEHWCRALHRVLPIRETQQPLDVAKALVQWWWLIEAWQPSCPMMRGKPRCIPFSGRTSTMFLVSRAWLSWLRLEFVEFNLNCISTHTQHPLAAFPISFAPNQQAVVKALHDG